MVVGARLSLRLARQAPTVACAAGTGMKPWLVGWPWKFGQGAKLFPLDRETGFYG
jgi:hypothetical protein